MLHFVDGFRGNRLLILCCLYITSYIAFRKHYSKTTSLESVCVAAVAVKLQYKLKPNGYNLMPVLTKLTEIA